MTRVYIQHLPSSCKKSDLEDVFSKYGRLEAVWISSNPPGFGFLEYNDPRDASDAARAMDKFVLMGNVIRVEVAHFERKKHTWVIYHDISPSLIIGCYPSENEAEEAYIEFLSCRPDFEEWVKKVRKNYRERFGRELIDIKESIFRRCSDENYFWLNELVNPAIETQRLGKTLDFSHLTFRSCIVDTPLADLYKLVYSIHKYKHFKNDLKTLAHLYLQCWYISNMFTILYFESMDVVPSSTEL